MRDRRHRLARPSAGPSRQRNFQRFSDLTALDFVIEAMPAAPETAYRSILGVSPPTDFPDFGGATSANSVTVPGGEIVADPTYLFGLFDVGTAIGLIPDSFDGSPFLDCPDAADLGASGVRDTDASSPTFGRRAAAGRGAAAGLRRGRAGPASRRRRVV